jgi:hypothetical protein
MACSVSSGLFGRLVLERIAPEALEGKAKLSFEPECLHWELEVPATRALSSESTDEPSPVRRV